MQSQDSTQPSTHSPDSASTRPPAPHIMIRQTIQNTHIPQQSHKIPPQQQQTIIPLQQMPRKPQLRRSFCTKKLYKLLLTWG
ncbi:uncharacterized protein MYCFIDRAFT_211743 [Pseudocercospora fijiensis CIRAD86]|uniref:Uncharacterized protein n=1 Tax=Pseudocercospora fijiensis (strain CIRAD86) TaxID=383855 RepID=M2ZPQ2_PSEFD|nr:uncharacterized protein MYCFIDRAFT_211743 [Pseudocercospora fijiensis CIRAD86]EME81064.1 hypothetical protein MYCFIDRAFT_211743 [Pseudocercospora fijiensis CIRAD86]